MRAALRKLWHRAFPQLAAERSHRFSRRRRDEWGVTDLARKHIARHGAEVRRGPAAGLRYPDELVADVDAPVAKLVGAYEAEVQDVFVEAIAGGRRLFVDVGCAEGYYAVGFALAVPGSIVHAYDIAPTARSACRRLAEANGVAGQVVVHGRCSAKDLRELELSDSLVLIDIEGAEREFLGDGVAPLFARAAVLVEVHGEHAATSAREIADRFAATHEPREIAQQARDPARFPELAALAPQQREHALSEFRRAADRWLYLTPRDGHSQ